MNWRTLKLMFSFPKMSHWNHLLWRCHIIKVIFIFDCFCFSFSRSYCSVSSPVTLRLPIQKKRKKNSTHYLFIFLQIDWYHKEKEPMRQKFYSKLNSLIGGIGPTTSLSDALDLLLSDNSLVIDEMQVLMKNDYDFLTEIIHVCSLSLSKNHCIFNLFL